MSPATSPARRRRASRTTSRPTPTPAGPTPRRAPAARWAPLATTTGGRTRSPISTCPRCSSRTNDREDEANDGGERGVAPIALRRVPAARQDQPLHRSGDTPLDRLDLGQGAVLVILTLDHQKRRAH